MSLIIYFFIGLILGYLCALKPITLVITDKEPTPLLKQLHDKVIKPKSQFIEPVSDKEKWDNANSISDLTS